MLNAPTLTAPTFPYNAILKFPLTPLSYNAFDFTYNAFDSTYNAFDPTYNAFDSTLDSAHNYQEFLQIQSQKNYQLDIH